MIVDSGAAGVSKPDPGIFRLAAEGLGLPLGGLVHVGDSEPADVGGARAAGVYAIRFDGVVQTPSRRPPTPGRGATRSCGRCLPTAWASPSSDGDGGLTSHDCRR